MRAETALGDPPGPDADPPGKPEKRERGPLALVADVGGTYTRVALSDGPDILGAQSTRTADLERSAEAGVGPGLAAFMRECIAQFERTHGAPIRVTAGGVGVAAAVADGSYVTSEAPIGIPQGHALRDLLVGEFDIPIIVDNDANMAAFGELRAGAASGRSSFVLMTFGTNIGASLVVNGEVYRGVTGGAGEVGLLLTPATTELRLAAGRRVGTTDFLAGDTRAPEPYAWIEDVSGGEAMASAYLKATGIDSAKVLTRAASGDAVAADIARRAVEGWAFAISAVVALLDPEAILLGGGLIADVGSFLGLLRERVNRSARVCPPIELASLGESGALVGAGFLAREGLGDFASAGLRQRVC